ncbi:MAG: rod shape-determining protein MreD [Azoarcus sp.]|jgi:rod shape-determining protein MreD|nr:rod shape-determining protein MreD [Azoarcus sp.]
MQFTNRSNRILQPARPVFVYLSLFFALLLDYVPFGAWSDYVPDFVALVLAFWCIREPLYIGMGFGFLLGLLVDIGQGAAMGQHALAYVVLAFLANALARRVMWFPALLQAVHVLPILLISQVTMAAVHWVAENGQVPELSYFLPSIVGAIAWVPLTYILLFPQFQPVDRDENRPI